MSNLKVVAQAATGRTGAVRRWLAIALVATLAPVLAGSAVAETATEAETEGVAEAGSSTTPSADVAATSPLVLVAGVDSIIQPVVAEFLVEALDEADRRDAALFVIELSTPGGLLPSTRQIFSAMLESKTPVVVFVSPSGSQAASAGFFLLMAADVAAMAPGTNTGAAHPVGAQGEDIPGTMGEKVEQDAAATIRSLAARNGRDLGLAESAVKDSRSFTADEALELGLVDLLAPDLSQLLERLDGRRLVRDSGEERILDLGRPLVERVDMTPFQRARSALAHPNIAVMFMTLGGIGLFFEITHPGAIFPGVLGAIFLILGLYGTSVLPVNYAGLALLGLAGLLFLAEIKVQSFGLLTVGGVASLVLGSLMLFDSPDPAVRVSTQLIVVLAVVSVILVASLSTLAYRAFRGGIATGRQGLLQERGRARSPIGEQPGKVDVHGEIWNAVSSEPVSEGETVEVVAVDGLTLEVRPLR